MFESRHILSSRLSAVFAMTAVSLLVGYAQQTTAQTAMTCHSMDTQEEVPPEKLPHLRNSPASATRTSALLRIPRRKCGLTRA